MSPETPLATYSELRFWARRRFELFESSIIIETRSAKVEVGLDGVGEKPFPGVVVDSHRRNVIFTVLVSAGAAYFFFSDMMSPILGITYGVAILCALCWGVGAVYLWPRKIEYVAFRHVQGPTAFDVMRVGRMSSEFDTFVAAVSNHLGELRRRPTGSAEAAEYPHKTPL